MRFISVDFEVFGKVQGVFFRKNTQEKALKIGIVGWVKNTLLSTVIGQIQGKEPEIRVMQEWLRHEGSPGSKIEKTEFKNEKFIDKLEFKSFDLIRGR
ncbi:unnamed protein product [Gordionus sp. m RMFG-2023]|uniref:acylphosphatase-1-like n=1 Tax=Gordionus sp. m RMFG-2023 TaxID=3053472 RepID=UPI0030E4E9AB